MLLEDPLSSAQLFEVDVERLYQVADTVIGTVGLRYQPRYAGADHDLAIRWVERRKIEILQHFGHPRLKSHGKVAAHRERVRWNRVRLPQENQIAILVVAALRGGFELLAVQLAGIDFMVVERFERRGMAARKDRADVFVGVEPGLAQPIGWEQMARGRGRVGKRETVTFDFGDRLDARRGISSRAGPICIGLAVRGAEGGDCLGLRDLMGEHVTERSELADLELAVAHRLDLGV